MFISIQAYEFQFLLRPVVIGVLIITLIGVFWPIISDWRKRGRRERLHFGFDQSGLTVDSLFIFILFLFFGAIVFFSFDWELSAKLVPQFCGWSGLFFTGTLLAKNLLFRSEVVNNRTNSESPSSEEKRQIMDIQTNFGDLRMPQIFRRGAVYFGWLFFYLITAKIIGLLPAVLFFLVGFIRFHGKETWRMTFAVSLTMWGFAFSLFHVILGIPWPPALIGELFPDLRSIIALY